ncbi:MAG: rhodanese-like domain-containing protein [Gemmatimonadetes bacterium]|nr:rhodanese-like domain-containing protein [Gemmatimonadota bacterium]
MSLFSFLSNLLRDPNRLAPADFLARRQAAEAVLDVRTPREYAQRHLKGAINVNLMAPDFARQVERLTKKGKLKPDQPVYLYCRSGARSGRAARLLRKEGFAEAYNVGGLRGLESAGAKVGR